MSLETATWISDLNSSNPPGGDNVSQGDDHLRLLKAVLQATLPTASKAFYFPTAGTKSADFSVASTDMNKTFLVDTSGGSVTATLPTLVSGDAGWECSFIKTNTGTNPLFIAPPSGTIQSGELSGLSKTRRCIPGLITKAFWSGTAWICTRVVGVPLCSFVDFIRGDGVTTAPVGYEFANGTALSSSANYPDYYLANGSSLAVFDCRGRARFGRDNMGGSAANRITNAGSGITGSSLGAAGGAETVTVSQANLPVCNFSETAAHLHGFPFTALSDGGQNGWIANASSGLLSIQCRSVSITIPTQTTNSNAAAISVSSGGSGTAVNKIPPAIICNVLVVVE